MISDSSLFRDVDLDSSEPPMNPRVGLPRSLVVMRAFLIGFALCCLSTASRAGELEQIISTAQQAEARQESAAALEHYLKADQLRPEDPVILQKIARQYSDLVIDQPDDERKKSYALAALEYSEKAVALAPQNPVNVLSLAVCHGKLALYSDTRDKVRYSKLVRAEADRALALDPDYAWAHHVLGRWHIEVALLSGTARFVVKLFYGGLPEARLDEGVRHFQRATELEPAELNHWLELGFALRATGKIAAAREAWDHGLAMPSRGPHDEVAKQRARAASAALN